MKKRILPFFQALGWSLLFFFLIGGMGTLFAYLPDFDGTPVFGLVTVWIFSLAMAVAMFWNSRKPSWIATMIVTFCLATLFLANTFHALSLFFPSWIWKTILILVYIISWALPVLNSEFAGRLHEIQFRRASRYIALFFLLLIVLGLVGFIYFHQLHITPGNPLMLFIGFSSAFVAISFAQIFAYQVWLEWKRENQKAFRSG